MSPSQKSKNLNELFKKNIIIVDDFVTSNEMELIHQSIWEAEIPDTKWFSDGGKVETHRLLQSSFASGLVRNKLTPFVSASFGRRLEIYIEPYIRFYKEGALLKYHIDGEGENSSSALPLQQYSDSFDQCTTMIEYAANIYFSSNFDGGEIVFHHLDYSIKPKAGQLIMFPAGAEYAHSVNRINSGERKALIVFYTTDKLRELHNKINKISDDRTLENVQ